MKRKDITNVGLLSALTIGISAMIALSTPITAYASESDDDSGSSESKSSHESSSKSESHEKATSSAQKAADSAKSSVSKSDSGSSSDSSSSSSSESGSESSSESKEETKEESASASEAAKEAADTIVKGDADAGIDAADPSDSNGKAKSAIENLVEKVKDVASDSTDEKGKEKKSAISNYQDASENITKSKESLVDAEKEYDQAQTAYEHVEEEAKDAAEDAKALKDTVNLMKSETESASRKVESLVESIQSAGSNQDAEQAYQDLKDLVEETGKDLVSKKEIYDNLVKQYEAALQNLKEAQSALEEAEDHFEAKAKEASGYAQAAQKEVTEARTKVQNLADALDAVTDQLADESAAKSLSDKMKAEKARDEWTNSWNDKTKNIYDLSRATMRSVVENYYLPKVLNIDVVAGSCAFESLKGADGQEYNYTWVTYKYIDENGDEQDGKKYFNYDSLTRLSTYNEKLNLNHSQPGIVVFEKSELEIMANQKVLDYYYDGKQSLSDKDKGRGQKYKDGKFDVFRYVDEDGNLQLVIRDELEHSTDGNKVVTDADGNFVSINGYALTEVVQNKNSLFHDGDCLIVASDFNIDKYTSKASNTAVYKEVIQALINRKGSETVTAVVERSMGLNKYVADNASDDDTAQLITKYVQYKEATDKAKEAAENAQDQVDKLNDAINDVVSKSMISRRSMKAAEVLGIQDIADYLGLTVSDEDKAAMNDLTVAGLIDKLNEMKREAEETKETAEQKLTSLQKQFEDAEQDLADVLRRFEDNGSSKGSDRGSSKGSSRRSSGSGSAALNGDAQSITAWQAGDGTAAGTVSENVTGGDVIIIENERFATAASVEDALGDQEYSNIEDAASPTAATFEDGIADETVPAPTNLWWMFVVAAFGAAGERMWRAHCAKKNRK
ncbi:MAG: hypothetical protein K5641_09250 [Lachnospiraceae bacterium]|nr:hypothetical protein [Lachnospiraceae bacterium]